MIVNIISTQVNRSRITGPKKVFDNVLKGFDEIGVKCVFNKPINEYKYNWIHDDQKAIIEAGFVGKSVLVGPNTAVLPKDLPIFRRQLPKGSIYLHPSYWTIDIWNYFGFNESELGSWPVGIDTNEFETIDRKDNTKVLLYFKQRDKNLLRETKAILKKLNFKYKLIHYGFYKEEDYKKSLKECKFGIWIGCSESQGIGLQEALATNLPLIVLEAVSLFDTIPIDSKNYIGYDFPKELENIKTSTAPYFDDRCGIKIDNLQQLEKSIAFMLNNIREYKPRDYIVENLSLKKSAEKLVYFFSKIDVKGNRGYNYKSASLFLFYAGLLFKKWAWKWIWRKIVR